LKGTGFVVRAGFAPFGVSPGFCPLEGYNPEPREAGGRLIDMLIEPQGVGKPPLPPEPQTNSIFKNPLLYSSFGLAIVAIVVGWVLLSRSQENKRIDRQNAEARSEKQRENDRAALDQFGGKELDIQNFYASPGAVHRGGSVQLCYGVANAKTVTLEPQPNPVWPSYSRCVDVTPKKTTTYTLTVSDAAGNTKSQTVEVKVDR
jgi:hypothetical protein